jgi:hypothetical protein
VQGQSGGRSVVETTVIGQDVDWSGFKPRLRVGYGQSDGTEPFASHNDAYVRAVVIKEF